MNMINKMSEKIILNELIYNNTIANPIRSYYFISFKIKVSYGFKTSTFSITSPFSLTL